MYQENISIHKLKHNIILISKKWDQANSHLGIMINSGSVNEKSTEYGLAHLIEHCIFKGTKKKKSHQILSRLDSVGGELNAYTSKEETCYHASFRNEYFERAAELLTDISFNSTFPNHEIEKEKKVIIEEINAYKDLYSEQILEDFDEIFFKKTPLAHGILGTEKSLKKIERKQLQDFVNKNYTPKNLIIISVTNINIDTQIKILNECLQPLKFNKSKIAIQYKKFNYTPFTSHLEKETNQLHCVIGFPAFNTYDRKRYALILLNNIIGGPAMNSILNIEIREKNAWVYDVGSIYNSYKDHGQFAIYFGCDKKNYKKVINKIWNILYACTQKGFTNKKIDEAKNQLYGQFSLSMESGLSNLFGIGKSYLNYQKHISFDELKKEIDSLTTEKILQVAKEIFNKNLMSELCYVPKNDN